MALVGDEQVILYAYAPEILVFFDFVIVYEVGEFLFGAPAVDKLRDEVEPRFDGDHDYCQRW